VSYFVGRLTSAEALDEACALSEFDHGRTTAVFVLVVVATVIYGLINIRRALGNPQPTAAEIGLAGVAAGGGHA
jgi:hypothetical protein